MMHEEKYSSYKYVVKAFDFSVVMQVEIMGYRKYYCEKLAQCSAAVKKSYSRLIKKRDSKTENITEVMYICRIYLHPEF